jgi:hypothetical protein
MYDCCDQSWKVMNTEFKAETWNWIRNLKRKQFMNIHGQIINSNSVFLWGQAQVCKCK